MWLPQNVFFLPTADIHYFLSFVYYDCHHYDQPFIIGFHTIHFVCNDFAYNDLFYKK